jgi:beta-propeller repeat-containing protein
MRAISAIVGVTFILFSTTFSGGQDADPASPPLLKSSFGKLPVYIIENRGVYPDKVKYYIQGADKTLFFTNEGITFRLKGKDKGWVVKLEFVGVNPDAEPQGEDRQQAVLSYFKGPEKDWKAGLPTFSRVVYEELWPGIDLVYMARVNLLKYEFVVKPGADPSRIKLMYQGADVKITEAGALSVKTPVGEFEDAPPCTFQVRNSDVSMVEASYSLSPDGSGYSRLLGFHVGPYDTAHPLVIDPAKIIYCGFLGGSQNDGMTDVALDSSNNAYVCGTTWSDQSSFPVKVGPDVTYNGGALGDAFVAKVNSQGTGLIYCGYIGGADRDWANGIAVDSGGNAYVTGDTLSDGSTFPVKVGPDLSYKGGGDVFVAKVNATGTGLDYCGYIGGFMGTIPGSEVGRDIAVDSAGNAFVTGETTSTHLFPVKVGPDLTHNGGIYDAFVAKVHHTGSSLVYCGYIGGENTDWGWGIDVDKGGTAYVTGETTSNESSFPVKTGPDVTYNGGPIDAFVAKVSWSGAGLVYCGYIGGSNNDFGYDVVVNDAGNAFVVGNTGSTESSLPNAFPVIIGPDLTYNGGPEDAFVAKVQTQGQGLTYCGFIGGSNRDLSYGVAVDSLDNVYITGTTLSSESSFPVIRGPDMTFNGATMDVFVGKVDPTGGNLLYCGYIGGIGNETGFDLAVDLNGNVYVVGSTGSNSITFPVKRGPYLIRNDNQWEDGFIAKIAESALGGSGSSRPGGVVQLHLTSTDDAGLTYQLGSSLGSGPIAIDIRHLHLSADDLLSISVSGFWAWIFQGYQGVLDNRGRGKANINIPNVAALVGLRLHTAFVTLDPLSPSGVRSISDTFSFTISI